MKKPFGKSISYTPSIKAALNLNPSNAQEEETQQEVTVLETKNRENAEPFTEIELQEKWKAFADSINDKPNLAATLSHYPELKENYMLLFPIENSTQEDLIRDVKFDLLNFLRRELCNDKIELNTYYTEVIKTRRAYTDSDKLNLMAEKNPNILELKRRFNLDFDSGDH